jgi:hypothetical protein
VSSISGGGERLVDDLNDLLFGHAVLVTEPEVAVKVARRAPEPFRA